MNRYPQLLARGQHYWRQREFARAAAAFADALRLAPARPEAHFFLGTLFGEQGQFDRAIGHLVAAHERAPERADILINLGAACQRAGRLDAAADYLTAARARQHTPTAELHYNLGIVEQLRGHPHAAADCFAQAAEQAPGWAPAWTSLAHNRMHLGQVTAARADYARARAAAPDEAAAWSNVCWAANYDEAVGDAELAALHREFGARWHGLAADACPAHLARPADGRVTVGFLSPNLSDHAVAYFIEPLFRHYDRRAFRFIAYASAAGDEVSRRLLAQVDDHHDVRRLPDGALRQRLADDGVDILVDLAGHTAHNRLTALAPRAAAVQVSAIGYPTTTGLDSVDALLSDAALDPADGFDYSEQVVRLPSFCCYQPPADAPPPGPLPALSNGHLTFGSFQNFAKISPATVARWSRLLAALPTARLQLRALGGGEPATRALLHERFRAHGIAPERVTVAPFAAREDYLASHQALDVCLDTTPWNGHTTTCHALWMGVPTLTRTTSRRAGRMGLALLRALDLADAFAAPDDDTFVALGCRLADRLDELATLRAGLRTRLAGNRLTDGPAYARSVESALRQLLAAPP